MCIVASRQPVPQRIPFDDVDPTIARSDKASCRQLRQGVAHRHARGPETFSQIILGNGHGSGPTAHPIQIQQLSPKPVDQRQAQDLIYGDNRAGLPPGHDFEDELGNLGKFLQKQTKARSGHVVDDDSAMRMGILHPGQAGKDRDFSEHVARTQQTCGNDLPGTSHRTQTHKPGDDEVDPCPPVAALVDQLAMNIGLARRDRLQPRPSLWAQPREDSAFWCDIRAQGPHR